MKHKIRNRVSPLLFDENAFFDKVESRVSGRFEEHGGKL